MTDHNPLGLFNEPHIVSILLYIRDNPGCRRTELYRNVARNDRMSLKIGMLIDAGLITDDTSSNRSFLSLTPKGMEVVASFDRIIRIIDDDK